ncbi:hypothetical protein EYZ11_004462 [Aspergillus tanneri]|uniref:Uncharacterized protein n=1 Tax=Aspergillus tanneri TaxID=1220188 RepID=A0A4S3JRB8_9EURO|nr:hypothetical protein EYZ11_004462 [Aspergillus tanneri]
MTTLSEYWSFLTFDHTFVKASALYCTTYQILTASTTAPVGQQNRFRLWVAY